MYIIKYTGNLKLQEKTVIKQNEKNSKKENTIYLLQITDLKGTNLCQNKRNKTTGKYFTFLEENISNQEICN